MPWKALNRVWPTLLASMPVLTVVDSSSWLAETSWSFWKMPPAGGEVRSESWLAFTGWVSTLPPANR